MRMTNFDIFNKCLENTSILELESLGQENEERFIKFVKFVDILDETDPRKIEGKKLIGRMLEIEKYQKMQTAIES
jgi:hypothetical protein